VSVETEDFWAGKVHDMETELLDLVLQLCGDLPEGGTAVDEVIRHDGGCITVKFSGIDEAAQPPKPYSGELEFSPLVDGGWSGEWWYDDATKPRSRDVRMTWALTDDSEWIFVSLVDTAYLEVVRVTASAWDGNRQAYDTALAVARDWLVENQPEVKQFEVWDDCDHEWVVEEVSP
jgi:hypothetical protein